MSLAARLLLDLGGVEQSGDDRRRADADRDAGLDQLVAALLVAASCVVARRSWRALYGFDRAIGKPHEHAVQDLAGAEGRAGARLRPGAHAALSASAGTGKTQVLTARVLRLLLKGARPESILCLTFTKAAAAEMANRIGARLAAWVRLKDSELATDLRTSASPTDPEPASAPGSCSPGCSTARAASRSRPSTASLKSLLAAFPAEAGIVPGFQPIEGRAEQELVRRTLADLMADAEASRRRSVDPRRPVPQPASG